MSFYDLPDKKRLKIIKKATEASNEEQANFMKPKTFSDHKIKEICDECVERNAYLKQRGYFVSVGSSMRSSIKGVVLCH